MSSQIRQEFSDKIRRDTGLDEAVIAEFVSAFYERAREDDLLGPIFADHVSAWPQHLQTVTDFWSSVLLMSGRYHGRPMEKHQPLPVEKRHFDRWLELFETTVRETCSEAAAALVMEKARRIAKSLHLGILADRGELLSEMSGG